MTSPIIPFSIDAQGRGVLQEASIVGGTHTIRAEGHQAFGGTDSAPSPLDYALAALTSCNQVTGQIVAAGDSTIELGEWSVKVQAHLDSSVLVAGAEGTSNFRDVALTVEVETNLDGERFTEFAAEVERRCPVSELFRASGVEFTANWINRPLAQSVVGGSAHASR